MNKLYPTVRTLTGTALSLLFLTPTPNAFSADAPSVHCLRDNAACYKACSPPTNECMNACGKQYSSCMSAIKAKAAEVKSKAEEAAKRCLSLPQDRKYYSAQMDEAWRQKKANLQDTQKTLEEIRADLQSDYAWTVGDPASAREMATYLAMVTKTTADLINDLGGFSQEKSAKAAKEIYQAIKDGKTAYKVATEDASKVVVDILFDRAAEINPILRGAKTAKDFAENMKHLMTLPGDMAQARGEFTSQMDSLARQISSLQRKMDQLQRDSEPDEIDGMFQTFQAVRNMCEPLAVPSAR